MAHLPPRAKSFAIDGTTTVSLAHITKSIHTNEKYPRTFTTQRTDMYHPRPLQGANPQDRGVILKVYLEVGLLRCLVSDSVLRGLVRARCVAQSETTHN